MKVILVAVYKKEGSVQEVKRIAHTSNLASYSYFVRGTLLEHFLFLTRTIAQRTPSGTRQTINTKEDLNLVCHVYHRVDGLIACVVCDTEYPKQSGFIVANRALDALATTQSQAQVDTKDQNTESKELKALVDESQNPINVDKLLKIQTTLDDIKDTMNKNIDEILQAGETLSSLSIKADDLSRGSKDFYTKARSQNSCCKRALG